jgi:hypothetical protein
MLVETFYLSHLIVSSCRRSTTGLWKDGETEASVLSHGDCVASCGLLTTAGMFKFKSSSFYGVCRAVIVIVIVRVRVRVDDLTSEGAIVRVRVSTATWHASTPLRRCSRRDAVGETCVHGWYMYVHKDETRMVPRHLMLDRVYADCPSKPDANSAKQPKRYVVIGVSKTHDGTIERARHTRLSQADTFAAEPTYLSAPGLPLFPISPHRHEHHQAPEVGPPHSARFPPY